MMPAEIRTLTPLLIGKLLLVVLAYFASGQLGLAIPYVGSHITLFWLPTGIAVAVLFRFGISFWPAIYLGALLVNLSIGSSWPVAAGIAVGNTVAPLLTTWLLQRMGFHAAFDRREDILLLCTAAAAGMLVSAISGSLILSLVGLVTSDTFFSAALAWWAGDFVGVLLGGPLLLAASLNSLSMLRQRYLEFIGWIVLTCMTGLAVFTSNVDLAFLPFPMVVWAAMRFGVPGASISVILLSLISVSATSLGMGQFYPDGLFQLWAYMSILAISGLMITALLAERRLAEDRSTLLLQSVSQAVWGLDTAGKVTFVNAAAVQMFGYSSAELIGKCMHRYVHHTYQNGSDYPVEACPMHATLSDGQPRMRKDEVMWRKDGSSFPVEYSSYPLRSEGRLLGVVVVCQDNTERKIAEEQLRESNEKLRNLFDLSPLGIALTDMQGRYVEFNEAFRRICGYSNEELRQLDYWKLTPQEYAEQEAHQLDCLEQGGRYGPYEKEYIRKDGTRVPLQLNGMLVTGRDGQRYIWSIVEDISERKFAEQRLQEDQERLHDLIESAMDAIVSTDENQNILIFNHAAERMFGYRADDLIGQPLERLIPPRFHATHHHHVEEFGRTGITSRTMDVPGIAKGLRANGREFSFEASISQVEVAGRKVYTAILRDITVRKQAEEEIKGSQALLEAISQAQSQFITGSEHRATFDSLLKILLDYSCSEYGFIGEVFHDAGGAPYLKTHAITNIAWNEETRALYETHVSQGLEFRNPNTLFGAVMVTGQVVISNDPLNDPRAGGLPPGHPAMSAFLGIPLYKGDALIGMLGIANRAGGYDKEFCEKLAPLVSTCTSLIVSRRVNLMRMEAETALQHSEERLRQTICISGIGLFDLDHRTGEIYISQEMRMIFDIGPDEAATMAQLIECFDPADREKVIGALNISQSPAGDGYFALSPRLVLRSGATRWLAVQFQTSFTNDERDRLPVRTICTVRDITQRRQNEEALQLAASVYQESHEGIVMTDEDNLILDVNPAFTQLTGYSLDEVRGKNPSLFKSGKHDQKFYQAMWQSIQSDDHWQGEIWDRRKDGELQAKWLSISVIRRDDGRVFRYLGQFSDVTEKKSKDELIWTQANFDALTNLPNRRLLMDRVQQSMSSSMRSGKHGALLSLDLDHFKLLNDTFGHGLGDLLLIEVAHRLKACVREEDSVARLGGDEFIVVLNELSSHTDEAANQAELVAEKIRSELSLPYLLGELEYHNSCSIGIVIFRGHLDNEEELFSHVDTAMYQAKNKGRNMICFFDDSMQKTLEHRNELEKSLRGALARHELSLHYQLQVDSDGSSIGVEALLRWHHPALGMVSPVQFIPVAEETGLILPIGQWVLETACAQLSQWKTDPRLSKLTIAVNVSARQFREPSFVTLVRETLHKSGANPKVLKLELTESLVLDNIEESIEKMLELKKIGVKFSMDDFGTGYSSLSYLSRLPIDQLKIDQSFVRDITTDQNDAAIVQTIIAMALSMGMDVIAEGVETIAQREFLELRGCLAYQGYLYAKPLPIDELICKLAS
jgi:diguanylate cyclase (GGDEF)-like protein/PAS domain S-box-containing protein